jgi:hypothetical protein
MVLGLRLSPSLGLTREGSHLSSFPTEDVRIYCPRNVEFWAATMETVQSSSYEYDLRHLPKCLKLKLKVFDKKVLINEI